MVEATKTLQPVQQPKTITLKRPYQIFEAYVSTGETITLEVGTLAATEVLKISDGSAVAHTKAGSVITITETLTDELVVGIGIGPTPT